MSEIVSTYVNYAKRRGEHIEKVVEIYDSADTVRGHDFIEEKEATVKKSLQTQHTAGGIAGGRCYRVTAVCVLLLCVLLLTAVTVLWVKYNNLNREKDKLQTSYDNLNMERDQLRTSYNNMRDERKQLKFQRDQLQFQRDQLQLHSDQLQFQRDQLQQKASDLQHALLNLGCRVFSSNVYCISTEKKYWSESKEDCRNRGGDLVIINSTTEQEFISTYFGSTEAWIGLTDTEKEGTFKWVDGTPLTTNFWWKEEPNDYGYNEDCTITGFRMAKSNMSTWADYPCDFPVVGICEMKIFN